MTVISSLSSLPRFSNIIIQTKMVKVYYEYEFDSCISQPVNGQCNFLTIPARKLIICGVNQYVAVIGLKTGESIKYLYEQNKNVNVRYLKSSPNRLYVGYEDGHISVYEMQDWSFVACLDNHKSAITSIDVDQNDIKMISGCMGGTLCIWDLLSEDFSKVEKAHSSNILAVLLRKTVIAGKPIDAIFSLSRDGFLKVWNSETRLCLAAVTTQTTEAYDLTLDEYHNLIYVATNKQVIPIVKFNPKSEVLTELLEVVGMAKRPNYSRVVQILFQNHKLYALNSDKKMQIYQIVSEEQLQKKIKKLAVAHKKKAALNAQHSDQAEQITDQNQSSSFNNYELGVKFIEEKSFLEKVHNFCVIDAQVYYNNDRNICKIPDGRQQDEELRIAHPITNFSQVTQQLLYGFPFLVQRTNDAVYVYNSNKFNLLYSIDLKVGHMNIFGGFLMLCTKEQLKIWDLAKNQEVFSKLQAWTGCWVQKNKCLLWRQNVLAICDLGYDKQKRIKIRPNQTKTLEEKITSACYTPAMQKYAVNLQNCQIHIFYSDSNKIHLKLYGHKLPITSFQISSDGNLLVSASVDKDIRLWDMQFGHCIKSIFAHQLPLTDVKFIKDTHYVLSVAKDAHLKMWDGDTYELIQDLDECMQEVRSLVVGNAGEFIAAGGIDGGFRIWVQSGNQTIASDQEEKRMEKIMVEEYSQRKLANNSDKTTYEDLKHGEEIIEAIEQGQKPLELLKMLKKIPRANLNSSISFLHTGHRAKLQKYMEYFIDRQHEVETCFKVLDGIQSAANLGPKLRAHLEQTSETLGVNRQILNAMLKSLKERNMQF